MYLGKALSKITQKKIHFALKSGPYLIDEIKIVPNKTFNQFINFVLINFI